MSYEEQQARKSRVVVETPTERREVVSSQSVHTPDRSGISAGLVGVLVVVAIALVTILVLFWMSSQTASDQNANLAAASTTAANRRTTSTSATATCDHSTTSSGNATGADRLHRRRVDQPNQRHLPMTMRQFK